MREGMKVRRQGAELVRLAPEIADVSLDCHGVGLADVGRTQELEPREPSFREVRAERSGERAARRLRPEDARRELGREGEDEEIEVVGGVEQDVVLTGGEAQESAGVRGERRIADAEEAASGDDDVELRFVVKVTGPAEGRLVTPDLGACSRSAHGKRLVQARLHMSAA